MLTKLLCTMNRPPPRPTLLPYTTLFRSRSQSSKRAHRIHALRFRCRGGVDARRLGRAIARAERRNRDPGRYDVVDRSEEHTSELQSRRDLVCRLLLEKKKYMVTNYRVTR